MLNVKVPVNAPASLYFLFVDELATRDNVRVPSYVSFTPSALKRATILSTEVINVPSFFYAVFENVYSCYKTHTLFIISKIQGYRQQEKL